MKKKGRISIAILMCITMISSTLFSSAAVFAESGDGYPTDKIEKYMDSKAVTINTSDGQYNPGDSLDPNGSFEFSIAFSERDNGRQFPSDGKMYYKIPEAINISEAITNADILEEGSKDKVIGTYSISKEGTISVKLDKEYIEKFDNVRVYVSFRGSFEKTFTEGGGDKYIEFADGVKVQVDFKKIVNLTVTKHHDKFDYEKNELTYTVNVKTDNDTTDVIVTDTPSNNLVFKKGTLKVHDNKADKDISEFETIKDDSDGWQIKFAAMSKDADYSISYTAKLSDTALDTVNNSTNNGVGVAVDNKVTCAAKDAEQKETTDGHTINAFQKLQKDVTADKENNKLTWKVTVNAKKFFDVSGYKVVDTLPDGLTLKTGTVKVEKDGKATGAQVVETEKGWEYQIPAEPKNNRSTYTFTYDTNLPVNDTVKDVTYKNRVQLIWSGKTITVDKGYTVGKGIETSLEKYLVGPTQNGQGTYNQAIEMDQDGNRYIHYGVKIQVPAGGIPNAVLRDVVRENSSHQLNKGLNHELYHELKVATREEIKDKPVEEKFQYITIVNYDPKKLVVDQTELGTGGFKAYFGDKTNSIIPDKGGKPYQIYLQYYTKITGTQFDQSAWNYMYLELAGGNSVSDWEQTNIQTKLSGKKDGTYDPNTKTITWKVYIDTEANKAGLGTDPVFVEDQFTDNQTYVEGSATLNNSPLAAGKVTVKDGKYKFDLGKCKSLQQYTLIYKTKVKEGVFDKGDVVYFKNKAIVKNDSGILLDIPEKVLTESNKTIGKQMTQGPGKDNDYTAKYTLTVNPNKGILAGAGSEYIIEDEYSDHLRIDTDSIKIKKDDKDILTQDQYTLSGGINQEPLKITIPDADGHKFVITYNATAFGNVGDTIELKNTATFKAGMKSGSSGTNGKVTFEEQHSTAGGIGSKSAFSVMKCDNADINKVLAGAEFELYKDSVASANYLGSAITEKDGKAEFSKANLQFNNKPYNPESGVKYVLVEKNAPTGYQKGDNVEFQILGDNPQLDNVTLYQMRDTIKVTNQKYNFYIKKIAEESGAALSGAEFSLFNDNECKTEAVQTVKEDKNNKGHFTFKGLTPKTYYMKETKVPEGYYDSKTIYTVVIDKEGNAKINGKAVSLEDRTYTITNTKAGSISVTKEVKEDGVGIADSKTYFTALFSDSDLKKRVSEVKELKMDGKESTSVTFTGLKVNETYYVAETDQDGNAYSNEENAIGSVISYENQKVTLDPSNLKAESKITNSYYTDYYWSGSIDVTKRVTVGGDKARTDKVFYVGLYNDKNYTDRVGDIKTLDMGGNEETTVTFSDLSINNTYYVAETDKDGNVITDAKEQLGCEMTIDNNKISLTKEKTEGAAQITNAFPDQYNFYIKKTSAHTGEALTGAEFTLYEDKDCKDEIVKATGDKDGKFAFKNLQKGTYYLKETKIPDGYYDAKKVYEVKIDKDGIAEVDGEAVKGDDKTYTIANTLSGSIKVTKVAKEDGLDTDVYKMTYFTALFSDKGLTKRVSDVKALEMDGIQSTSVTFDGLKVGKTYYVAETDQDGNALPRQNDEGKWLVDYENQVVKLDPSNLDAESKITNSYYSDFYWSGSIDVTKLVTMGGDKTETNKVFYVGLYNDKDFTDRVGDIQALKMNGKASTTVTFSDLPLNHTYYVAETDQDGTVITAEKAEQQGYKITFDNQKVSLTKENQIGAAKITNAFDDEYNFYIQKTKDHTGEALTGAEFTLFKDSNCTNKKVTVKGDDNGKFAFKNLMEGTYFLKETKVPEGYHDSEKVYTVVIDADGKATIDGNAANAEDKTYTITNTLAGKIKVTKDVKEDGIGTEDFGTYYTALFSDSDFQNRVTEVKAIEMKGNQSTSVTFDNLKANETYYVAETNADGNALTNENNELGATIAYENQVVTLDPNNLSAKSKITNSFYSGYYWAGSIDVTKRVTVGGKAAETNNIFYVGVYTDKACTEQVGDIQPLVMDGNAETKVTFSDLPLNHTYYVAETDSTGKVITDSKEQLGCKMTIDNSKISLTKENQTGEAKITNDFPDEEQFYYDGQITVKKTTTYNGKSYNTDDVFYVALFADKAHTKRLTDVKSLEMNGGSKATVSFENLAYGAYYLAETDKSGKALSDVEAAKLGYTNLFDETIQLDENPVDIELENQMTQEYVKAVQTGDESNMALAVLGLLAALTVMGILVISRKRKTHNE